MSESHKALAEEAAREIWRVIERDGGPVSIQKAIERFGHKLAAQMREPEIPLCADHAQTWFTERNHLTGGMRATCVVCAHALAPAPVEKDK